MLGDNLEPLGLGEAGDGAALGVNAKSRAALFGGANPVIGDDRLGHDDLDLPPVKIPI